MDPHWTRGALDIVARSERCALVSVVSVEGSTPREAGARMIVSADSVSGTVGGGALEFTLIDQARKLLASGADRALQQSYPLGPLLQQCCGGRMGVLIETLGADAASWLSIAETCEERRAPYTLVSRFEGDALKHECEPRWVGGPREAGIVLDGDGRLWRAMTEYVRPRACDVFLFGAGHVGAACAHFLERLPVRLTWLDARADCEGATYGADLVARIEIAPVDAVYLIMTHSHELDFELTRAVLARGDFRYCGLIGSRTKRARFVKRLADSGVAEEAIARLVCPIGSIGLAGKEPAVIALAVAAEVMLRVEAETARA